MDASLGDTDGDGDYDALFSFGARSMSIFDDEGHLVADTGDLMESVTASVLGENFSSTNDENDSFDNRSDDKGPEPEGITIGYLNLGRPVAFVGLERIGGIMAFDLSDPTEPAFLTYINTRDFSGDAEAGTAGDLAPEGLTFIAASESPTGTPLLAVSFEVSGSTRFFEIESGFGEEICNDPGPDSFTADGFEGLEQGGVACAGVPVAAISIITNLAAGLAEGPLSHEQTQAVAAEAAEHAFPLRRPPAFQPPLQDGLELAALVGRVQAEAQIERLAVGSVSEHAVARLAAGVAAQEPGAPRVAREAPRRHLLVGAVVAHAPRGGGR